MPSESQPRHFIPEYEITVAFLDDGQVMVQVQGVPYPLGMFKETGWDLDRLLSEAKDAIVHHRNMQSAYASGRERWPQEDPPTRTDLFGDG